MNFSDKVSIGIREGIEFHYFGSGCIADYYGDSVAYLDEKDMEIISDFTHPMKKEELCKKYVNDNKESKHFARIEELYKKGVLALGDYCTDVVTNNFHGVKGKYYPKELVIELTNKCNYKCPFCYKSAKDIGEFISDEMIRKINNIISNKITHVLFTGGEPTLHPHYLNYLALFSQYAKVHMITNGSVLYKHDPDLLQKFDLIQFTLYGCSNSEYEKMTGMSDGLTRLYKSVELVKRNGIKTQAAVTLCDSTIDHIELFVKLAIELEMKTLRIGLADIFGRGKYLFSEKNDYDKKRDKAYDIILDLKRKYREKIYFELPNIYSDHVMNHNDITRNVIRNSLSCGCGSEYLVISQKGEIRPCQMLPEAWFSIKSKEGLCEHINGNFHISELSEAVKEYYADNKFETMNISPCQALDKFMTDEKRKYVSKK